MRRIHEQEKAEQTKLLIDSMLNSRRSLCIGRIDEYDAATHSVRVKLLPHMADRSETTISNKVEDITGFIPLLTTSGGGRWGVQYAPIVREAHTVVAFIGWPVTAMFALGVFYTNVQRPPAEKLKQGEFYLSNSSGTKIYIHQDDTTEIWQPSGSHITIHADGKIEIFSNREVYVHSNSVLAGLKDAVEKLVQESFKLTYDTHMHTGVETGSGTSGPPVVPMPASDLTVNTKAS